MATDSEQSVVEPVAEAAADSETAEVAQPVAEPVAEAAAEAEPAKDESVSGPRVRKTVQRMEVAAFETKELEFPEGKGTALGEIANVEANISATSRNAELLKVAHRFAFGKPCKALQIKDNLLKFSGLVYEGDEETEREKVVVRMHKCQLGPIKEMMDLFGVRGIETPFQPGLTMCSAYRLIVP